MPSDRELGARSDATLLGPVSVWDQSQCGHGTKPKCQEEWGKVLSVFCSGTFCSFTWLSSVRVGKALTGSLVRGGWSLGQQWHRLGRGTVSAGPRQAWESPAEGQGVVKGKRPMESSPPVLHRQNQESLQRCQEEMSNLEDEAHREAEEKALLREALERMQLQLDQEKRLWRAAKRHKVRRQYPTPALCPTASSICWEPSTEWSVRPSREAGGSRPPAPSCSIVAASLDEVGSGAGTCSDGFVPRTRAREKSRSC